MAQLAYVKTPWDIWDWRKLAQEEDFSYREHIAGMGYEVPFTHLLEFNKTFLPEIVEKSYGELLQEFVNLCKENVQREVVALIATETSFSLLTKIEEIS